MLGNEYLQEAAPWTAIKTDQARAAVAVRTALNLVALFAKVSEPFIPFAAEKIAEAVGETVPRPLARARERTRGRCRPAGPWPRPEVLFRKIEDAQVAEWLERFGGPQVEVEPA